jgi:hypothetical protein
MRNNRIPKDELYEVEAKLYDEYGTVEDVLETIEEYSYGHRGYADFIHEVLDYYSSYDFTAADALQIYRDFADIGEVKYYDGYLELSDDHIMWDIDADIDDETYYMLADDFIDSFEKEYDVHGVTYVGRSGRHVLCPDTWENVLRYDELVAGMKKCEQDFIDYINSNYGGSTEEPRVRYF